MTYREIIFCLQQVKEVLEWEYPLDWQIAVDEAMRIVEDEMRREDEGK